MKNKVEKERDLKSIQESIEEHSKRENLKIRIRPVPARAEKR